MLSCIAAMDEGRVIGAGGGLPWHLPNDLKYFREKTIGHTVIMGRKTYEERRQPLPKRVNIVISRDAQYAAPGCTVVTSLDQALALCKEDPEPFVIGGGEIFREAIPRADRIYLTIVHGRVEGDARMPEIDFEEWKVVSKERHDTDAKHAFAYTFQILERKK